MRRTRPRIVSAARTTSSRVERIAAHAAILAECARELADRPGAALASGAPRRRPTTSGVAARPSSSGSSSPSRTSSGSTVFGMAAFTLGFVVWLAVLFERRAPRRSHRFLVSYVRYTTHLSAYLTLAADPYPGFTGAGPYPVDVEIGPPRRQGRLGAGFRLLLAVPAFLVSSTLAGSAALGASVGTAAVSGLGGLATVAALLGWFACLARGRMPRGLRDATTYAIGYGAQTTAYALLLDRPLPGRDPGARRAAAGAPAAPDRDPRARRPRPAAAARRLPSAARRPAPRWLALWAVLAALAAVAAWLRRARPRAASRARCTASSPRSSATSSARLGVPPPRRPPVPRLRRARGQLPDRPHDRAARPPAPARRAGAARRSPSRRSSSPAAYAIVAARRRDARLVRRARHGPDARRAARPRRGMRCATRRRRSGTSLLLTRGIPTRRRGSSTPPGGGDGMTAARDPWHARASSRGARRVALGRRRVAALRDRRAGRPRAARGRRRRRLRRRRSSRARSATSASSTWTGRSPRSRSSSRSPSTRGEALRFARESAAGPIGTGMLLGMLGLALAWLVAAPVLRGGALVGSASRPLATSGTSTRSSAAGSALAGTFVALSLALARRDGARAPARLVVVAPRRGSCSPRSPPRSSSSAPYLTTGLEPSDDHALEPRVRAVRSARRGSTGVPLRVEKVSGDTSQANAYAFGHRARPGGSCSGTRCSTAASRDREVDVVLAHELGHHSSDHIPKAIGWFALFALPGALVLMLGDAAARRDGRARGRSARAARRRRLPARRGPGAEPRQPPDGERGRLEGAPRRRATRPRRAGSSGVRRDLARRPEPADVGVPPARRRTRRSPSGSRWPTPGRRASAATTVETDAGRTPSAADRVRQRCVSPRRGRR